MSAHDLHAIDHDEGTRAARRRVARRVGVVAALFAVVVAALAACGLADFDPQSKVDSVRVFAVKASKPYAKPGEEITLEALVTDGRAVKTRPLKLFWLPLVCVNPPDDLYYLCFLPGSPDGGAGGARLVPVLPDGGSPQTGTGVPEAGADGGAAAQSPFTLPPGFDLSPFLPQGSTFRFRMPDDAVIPRKGGTDYGLAVVFNVACAGRVVTLERSATGGPQQLPFACVDEQGERVPPEDYVISLSRVYAYNDRVNTNPKVLGAKVDGVPVPLTGAAPVEVERCTAEKKEDCKEIKIDIDIAPESWEEDPNNVSPEGRVAREQIWVTYYSDVGEFQNDARLLFDTKAGRVEKSEVVFRAPKEPKSGTVWAVIHDNRAGAEWVVFPIRVK